MFTARYGLDYVILYIELCKSVVTTCTVRFNTILRSAHTVYFYVLCGSENKQRNPVHEFDTLLILSGEN